MNPLTTWVVILGNRLCLYLLWETMVGMVGTVWMLFYKQISWLQWSSIRLFFWVPRAPLGGGALQHLASVNNACNGAIWGWNLLKNNLSNSLLPSDLDFTTMGAFFILGNNVLLFCSSQQAPMDCGISIYLAVIHLFFLVPSPTVFMGFWFFCVLFARFVFFLWLCVVFQMCAFCIIAIAAWVEKNRRWQFVILVQGSW